MALSNAMRKDDRHKCQSLVWCKTTTIKLKRRELMTDDTHKLSEPDAFPYHFTTQHVFKVHLHMNCDGVYWDRYRRLHVYMSIY